MATLAKMEKQKRAPKFKVRWHNRCRVCGRSRAFYRKFELFYVVADEQNHHFATLFELLKRLEEPYAAGLFHLEQGRRDGPSLNAHSSRPIPGLIAEGSAAV